MFIYFFFRRQFSLSLSTTTTTITRQQSSNTHTYKSEKANKSINIDDRIFLILLLFINWLIDPIFFYFINSKRKFIFIQWISGVKFFMTLKKVHKKNKNKIQIIHFLTTLIIIIVVYINICLAEKKWNFRFFFKQKKQKKHRSGDLNNSNLCLKQIFQMCIYIKTPILKYLSSVENNESQRIIKNHKVSSDESIDENESINIIIFINPVFGNHFGHYQHRIDDTALLCWNRYRCRILGITIW